MHRIALPPRRRPRRVGDPILVEATPEEEEAKRRTVGLPLDARTRRSLAKYGRCGYRLVKSRVRTPNVDNLGG
jgi:hypothetical protein